MTQDRMPPDAAEATPAAAPEPSWGADLAVPLGLGTNTFGRTSDEVSSHRVLDRFAEAGGTLLDTADTYSEGASETFLGGWLRQRGNRDRILVSTKVGNHPPFDRLTSHAVTAGLQESLRRLGTDYVDVYFAHYQDDATPVEESVVAFDALVRAGTVRAVGLSNVDADTVREWISLARSGGYAVPVVLQPHYSLVHRQPYERDYAPLAAAEGLAVLPYRALGGGFLTGKYRTEADTEGRARGAGVRSLLTPEGLRLLDTLDTVARRHGVRPAAVALAWLLRQPTVTAPLASATSPEQLDDLLAATTLTFSDDELTGVTSAADADFG